MINLLLLSSTMLTTPAIANDIDTISHDSQVNCMALNMYFESKNQPDVDMYAVGHVVLNRMESDLFPIRKNGKIADAYDRAPTVNTTCDIVYDAKLDIKGNPIKNGCQFSWYCDGKPEIISSRKRWNKAVEISNDLLNDRYYEYDFTGGALWYHADYVMPNWAKTKIKTIQIVNHIYYR